MELFYQRFPEFKFKTDEEWKREELKKLTEHVTELLLQGKELYEVHRETGVDIDEVGDIYTKLVKGNKITPQKL
jgi:chromosome segregation and condensation protein ScpB